MKPLFRFLTRPDLFCYLLLWLIALLVAGTIAQKDIGLYQAHHMYFSSFFIWAFDIIPLPGTYLTLGIITFSLLIKTCQKLINRHHLGSFVTHLGALVLLGGSVVTAYFSEEHYMLLAEGERSDIIADYYALEMVIANPKTQQAIIFPHHRLKNGASLTHPDLPFTLAIAAFHINGTLVMRDEPLGEDKAYGMANLFTLKDAPRAKEEEQNISALTAIVSTQNSAREYLFFEDSPVPAFIMHDDVQYPVQLRHAQSTLPFVLTLHDVVKEAYPGVNKAKSYHSDVTLHDGDIDWKSRIAMNEPLRYGPYSIYQSSYIIDGERELTVLAVVQNSGRSLPYIASIIISLGLMIHLFQRTRRPHKIPT